MTTINVARLTTASTPVKALIRAKTVPPPRAADSANWYDQRTFQSTVARPGATIRPWTVRTPKKAQRGHGMRGGDIP
ncbi:hypothetical protein [Burkholderia sp. WAC0059]|uniref:hypothetical protein n=1 Tax=Burkholderia sp. WAC0059 TaxID=2066022 RepID=UPI0011AF77DF|nr:hypothetical protein [Burkholderia sp. WAC0059]